MKNKFFIILILLIPSLSVCFSQKPELHFKMREKLTQIKPHLKIAKGTIQTFAGCGTLVLGIYLLDQGLRIVGICGLITGLTTFSCGKFNFLSGKEALKNNNKNLSQNNMVVLHKHFEEILHKPVL